MSSGGGAEAYRILLAEDNPADIYLLRRALTGTGLDFELTVIGDGAEGLAFARREGKYAEGPLPDLAILDLDLPKSGGAEILEAIRLSVVMSKLPVVVMSSSSAPLDRAVVEQLRIARYITKPPDLKDFGRVGEVLKEILLAGRDGG